MEKPKLSSIQQHIIDSRAKMAEKLETDRQRKLTKIDLLRQLLETTKKIEHYLFLIEKTSSIITSLDKQIDKAMCLPAKHEAYQNQNDTIYKNNDCSSFSALKLALPQSLSLFEDLIIEGDILDDTLIL